MSKTQLQKELLEKIKLGVKASDLKKQKIRPKSPEKDLGYESEEEKPTLPNKEIKELKKQVSFWSNTASTHLKNLQLATAKITNLEEQLKNKKPSKSELELLSEKNKQIERLKQSSQIIA